MTKRDITTTGTALGLDFPLLWHSFKKEISDTFHIIIFFVGLAALAVAWGIPYFSSADS